MSSRPLASVDSVRSLNLEFMTLCTPHLRHKLIGLRTSLEVLGGQTDFYEQTIERQRPIPIACGVAPGMVGLMEVSQPTSPSDPFFREKKSSDSLPEFNRRSRCPPVNTRPSPRSRTTGTRYSANSLGGSGSSGSRVTIPDHADRRFVHLR